MDDKHGCPGGMPLSARKKYLFVVLTLFGTLGVSLGLAELVSWATLTRFRWSKYSSSPIYAPADDAESNSVRLTALGSSTAAGSPHGGFSLLTFMDYALRQQYNLRTTYTVCANGGWTLENAMDKLWSGAFPKPTVLVVYSGHNEICSRYTPNMKSPPFPILARLWTGRLLLHYWYQKRADFKNQNYQGDFFCHDPVPSYEQELNLDQYRKRLKALAEHCRREHITLVLVAPGSNLLFPPLRSVYRGPAERRDEAIRLFKQAYYQIHFRDPDSPEALMLLNRLAAFCSFAHLHYELGKIHYRQQRWDEAIKHLELARDLDDLSARCQGPFRRVVKDTAEQFGAVYIDMQEVVINRLGRPVPDGHVFIDDVHLYPEAYHELCLEILRKLQSHGKLAINEAPQPISRDAWPALGFSTENVSRYSWHRNLGWWGPGDRDGFLRLDELEFGLARFRGFMADPRGLAVELLEIILADLSQQIQDEKDRMLKWIGKDSGPRERLAP